MRVLGVGVGYVHVPDVGAGGWVCVGLGDLMSVGFGHFERASRMSNPEISQVEVQDNTHAGLRAEIERVRADSLIAIESVLAAMQGLRQRVDELTQAVASLRERR